MPEIWFVRDAGIFEQVLRISEIEELVEREKKIDLLKWNWMEDAVFFNYFTVERIFRVFVETGNDWPLDFYG